MADFQGDKKYAYYNFFMVGNAASKYKLQLEFVWTNLNEMAFSMYDRDNDLTSGNCALGFKGGWWVWACTHSQINGLYHLMIQIY